MRRPAAAAGPETEARVMAGACSTATPATPRAAAAARAGVRGSPSTARPRSATQTGKLAKSTAASPEGVHCCATNMSA